MSEQLRFALNALPPQGLALKRHILGRLLTRFPERLTMIEVAEGGPSRTDASVRGALKTLHHIGAALFLSHEETGDLTRCQLVPGTEDVIRTFLLEGSEDSRPLSPLPPRRAYQQVLRAMYEASEQSFTLKTLLDKVWSERVSVRAPLVELWEAGYLLRELTDESKHGRPEFVYRLNPAARDHADALLFAPTCSPQRRGR